MRARHATQGAILTAALVAAVLLSGCGNLSRGELQRGVQTLSAMAANGRLIADGVARDRTKLTYARVMSRTLSEEAQHEAEKLNDATPAANDRPNRVRAVRLAIQLQHAFGRLQTFAGNEGVGASVRDQMGRLQHRADQLDDDLGGTAAR